jgi:hypothetical protein
MHIHSDYRIILLLNGHASNMGHTGTEFAQIFPVNINEIVNSRSSIGIFSKYCLQKFVKCLLVLSYWFQIRALDTIILNWSIWTSSICMFQYRYKPSKSSQTEYHSVIRFICPIQNINSIQKMDMTQYIGKQNAARSFVIKLAFMKRVNARQ